MHKEHQPSSSAQLQLGPPPLVSSHLNSTKKINTGFGHPKVRSAAGTKVRVFRGKSVEGSCQGWGLMGQKRLAQIPRADGQEQGYTIPGAKTGQPPRPDTSSGDEYTPAGQCQLGNERSCSARPANSELQ